MVVPNVRRKRINWTLQEEEMLLVGPSCFVLIANMSKGTC